MEDYLFALAPYVDFLVDSGAFTDYHAQMKASAERKSYSPISLDEYIAACRRYDGYVWQYIALDVIHDPPATRDNLRRMVDAGLRPMPVFVYPESLDAVPELVSINPHISVAGGAASKVGFAVQRYQRVFKASGGKAKIHALGFTRVPQIFQLPLASVDSSTYSAGSRFGQIYFYRPSQGMNTVSIDTIGKERNLPVLRMLERSGVGFSKVKDPQEWRTHVGIPSLATIYAFVQLHRHCYVRGLRFAFAISNDSWLKLVLAVLAATHDMGFDFEESRRIAAYIGKADVPETVAFAVDVLKRQTTWQERLP